MEIILVPHQPTEPVPWQLLLQADPDKQKIEKYLHKSRLYVVKNESGEVIGVCVIQRNIADTSWEILNIAVDENQHNKGIGKQIIQQVIQMANEWQVLKLWVATGNSSIDQLAFYQKCGFEMHSIIPNYFTDNYSEKIIENGIECKHQVRLVIILGSPLP